MRLKWFCSTPSAVIHCHYGIEPCFRSGMSDIDLPRIQSSVQPEKIKKRTSELNYHEESTQDEELVAIT